MNLRNQALHRLWSLWIIGLILLVPLHSVFGHSAGISKVICNLNVDDAKHALASTYELKTWREVFSAYKNYRQCDNGGELSQNLSDDVAFLLASHWDQIGSFIEFANSDPAFETFVLHHIDETMTLEQGKIIENNVRSCCPSVAVHFCREVKKRFLELDTLR